MRVVMKGPGYREYECNGIFFTASKQGNGGWRITLAADEANHEKGFGYVDTASGVGEARVIIQETADALSKK